MTSITLFSAGSFRYALEALVTEFQQSHAVEIQCACGPAGLLRQRIEKGECCDLFISANQENVALLAKSMRVQQRSIIAFNRLALTTLDQERFRHKSFFELLLDRQLRLATSTPGCDPCGDYAWQLFDHIERVFPTEGEALKARALTLVGGEDTNLVPKGEIASQYLLSHDYADMMLGYAHYQVRLKNKGFLFHELPDEFAIRAGYVVALLSESAIAHQFFDFLSSEKAKEIMQQEGFSME